MDELEIVRTLENHENQIKSLKHRMDQVEENDKTLTEMAVSIKELAVNMSHMTAEQKKQGERLERLEAEPSNNYKFIKQTIIGLIASGVLGAIISFVMQKLLT